MIDKTTALKVLRGNIVSQSAYPAFGVEGLITRLSLSLIGVEYLFRVLMSLLIVSVVFFKL